MNYSAGIMSTNAVNVATTAGAKDKAAGGAGAQFFLGGILVLISTSWAASNIIKKNDPGYSYNPNAPIANQGIDLYPLHLVPNMIDHRIFLFRIVHVPL